MNLGSHLPGPRIATKIGFLLLFLACDASFAQSPKQIDAARTVTELLANGNYARVRSYLEPSLQQQLSEAMIQQGWHTVIGQTGEFQSISQVQPSTSQGFVIVEIWCATSNAGLIVRAAFRPGLALLNGLWVQPAAAPPNATPNPTKPSFP